MCRFIETLCIEQGEIKNVEHHNCRLNETRYYFWKEVPRLDVRDFIDAGRFEERTRCRLTYGREIEAVEYFPYTVRRIASLKLVYDDEIDYRFKWADRSVLDRLFAQRGEADDILIVRQGLLTDTSIANIALWNGDEWQTPATPLLNGTHRRHLLDERLLVERPIEVGQLPRYSRIRLFNAMIRFGEVELLVECIAE